MATTIHYLLCLLSGSTQTSVEWFLFFRPIVRQTCALSLPTSCFLPQSSLVHTRLTMQALWHVKTAGCSRDRYSGERRERRERGRGGRERVKGRKGRKFHVPYLSFWFKNIMFLEKSLSSGCAISDCVTAAQKCIPLVWNPWVDLRGKEKRSIENVHMTTCDQIAYFSCDSHMNITWLPEPPITISLPR